jgi:hypothetical protein
MVCCAFDVLCAEPVLEEEEDDDCTDDEQQHDVSPVLVTPHAVACDQRNAVPAT